jgi:hypothetical protein
MNRIAGWITDYATKFPNTVDRSPGDVAQLCTVSGNRIMFKGMNDVASDS